MTTTNYPEKEGVTCATCGKGFTDNEWQDRHTAHRPGCPHQKDEEPQCDCGDVTHANHCWHCCVCALEEQLNENCLDSYGNIYSITTEHVTNMADEFMRRHPDLIEKIGNIDKYSLAVQIQEYIGGVGIMDHIEVAISEAIRDRIDIELEEEDGE